MRIIDISNVFSLPYAAGLLADLGAEVIKVEGHSAAGHLARRRAHQRPIRQRAGDDPWNRIGGFNLLNRGKKSVRST